MENLKNTILQCYESALLLQDGVLSNAAKANVQQVESQLSVNAVERIEQCLYILQVSNERLKKDAISMANICAEQGSPFLCGAGCVSCCHHLVLCENVEALSIANYLKTHEQQRNIFLKNYSIWDKNSIEFRKPYMQWAKDYFEHGHDSGAYTVDYYSLPCPFIGSEGLCLIYDVRPYACRSTVSVNAQCADASSGLGGKYTMQYSLYTGHHIMRKALMKLCNFSHNSQDLLAMPQIVHEILT